MIPLVEVGILDRVFHALARASSPEEILKLHTTPYQIDHIISKKHDGPTTFENLAYSCPACSLNKGSDVAAYLMEEDIVVRLYHPRKDRWTSHFSLEDGILQTSTSVGAATIKLLNLNHPDYCEARKILVDGEVDLIPS